MDECSGRAVSLDIILSFAMVILVSSSANASIVTSVGLVAKSNRIVSLIDEILTKNQYGPVGRTAPSSVPSIIASSFESCDGSFVSRAQQHRHLRTLVFLESCVCRHRQGRCGGGNAIDS